MYLYLADKEKKLRKFLNSSFGRLGLTYVKSPSHEVASVIINSYEEYEQVNKIVTELYSDSMVLYRGQSANWGLIPSIARAYNQPKSYKQYKSGLLDKEFEYYQSLYSDDNIQKEKQCSNKIDFLTICQHYGAPTRLLDVTKNSDIALFFACEHVISDGYVYLLVVDSCYQSDLVSDIILSQPLILQNDKSMTVSDFAESYCKVNKDVSKKDVVIAIEDYYMSRTPLYVEPNKELEDERVKNQQGAFILFANQFFSQESAKIYQRPIAAWNITSKPPFIIRNRLQQYNRSNLIKIRIPCQLKNEIKTIIANKGITPYLIYPSFENYIKTKVYEYHTKLKETII